MTATKREVGEGDGGPPSRRIRFEVDLRKLDDRYVDDGYARELYAALCDNEWVSETDPQERYGPCSHRHAGALVAWLRAMGEYYGDFFLDFDRMGDEGRVSERVERDLETLGWRRSR